MSQRVVRGVTERRCWWLGFLSGGMSKFVRHYIQMAAFGLCVYVRPHTVANNRLHIYYSIVVTQGGWTKTQYAFYCGSTLIFCI